MFIATGAKSLISSFGSEIHADPKGANGTPMALEL